MLSFFGKVAVGPCHGSALALRTQAFVRSRQRADVWVRMCGEQARCTACTTASVHAQRRGTKAGFTTDAPNLAGLVKSTVIKNIR